MLAQLARDKALADHPPQVKPLDKPRQQQTPAGLGNLEILPPEIRNRIYNLVLIQPDRFNLETYQPHSELQYVIDGKPVSRVAGQEVAPVNHKRKTEHRCQELVNLANNEWIKVPNSTALVQVSKQFQAETSSIPYGSNKFEFTSTKALEYFLVQIGENKKHLREVGLRWQHSGHIDTSGRRAMLALRAAENLHTMSICGFEVTNDQKYHKRYIARHVEMCVPPLRSLHRNAENRKGHYLDVLKVDRRIPGFKPHPYGKGCNVWCRTTCAEHPTDDFGPFPHWCCVEHIEKTKSCKKDFKEYEELGEDLERYMMERAAWRLGKR
jgi:hypothetical protein